MKKIYVKEEWCLGCHLCEYECAYANSGIGNIVLALKDKEIDPNVKVLLSSGYVSEEDAKDVLDAGALGFLRKPYRMSDLAKAIRNIFDVNK